MDRLQLALEKAREQRERGHKPAPERAPRRPGKHPARRDDASAAWDLLAPLKIDPDVLVRNRLVTLEGGVKAAPFDMLRTRILQQVRKNGWRRIAIVSPHSECGKTTTAANLGFSFGRQKDLRTLVLDFDLRRMGLALVLDQKGQYTMADVLERRVPFQSHALRHEQNLAFGLNFGKSKNPSETLQSRQAVEVLEEIEAQYRPDLVLFDMPPLLASDDSHGFLRNVDCALLIAEAERTTIDQIDVAERQLADLTNVLGVVLNKCHFATSAYGYEYGAD